MTEMHEPQSAELVNIQTIKFFFESSIFPFLIAGILGASIAYIVGYRGRFAGWILGIILGGVFGSFLGYAVSYAFSYFNNSFFFRGDTTIVRLFNVIDVDFFWFGMFLLACGALSGGYIGGRARLVILDFLKKRSKSDQKIAS